jgi:cysteine-rich repeat protein
LFADATNDSWGSHVPDFEVTAQIHPGLCSVTPENGVSGDTVQLVGKNFGLLDSANDQVTFGNLKAEVGAANWSNETIKTNVPLLIDQGVVGIKVVNNGIESNGVRFVVNQGQSEDTPVISSITPNVGSSGEYITITGKNFGNTLGAVWFKSTPDSEAIVADTSFPEGCATSIWRDDQIIVKFPKNRGDNGTSYYLQVKTANNKITHLDQTFKFTLQPGDPSPGICSLSPVSAPLPFPEGNVMQIRGEYFGTDSEVYFWKSGAQAKTIDGRIPVTHNNLNSSSDTLLTLRPPTTLTTGPVIVYRPKDKKMSNPASFTVLDCVKNNNSCTTAGTVCCASGRDTGICKAVNELCSGAPASSGYVSRFSTADIPAIPHVVERCNDDTNVGKNIPTPAPSIQWDVRDTDEHHNVCRTALVTAEFTQALNQATVNNSTVLVNKCSSNKDINDCENPVPITLTADSYTLKAAVGQTGGILRHYLSLSPSTGRWDDATWYQVVFKKGISSQDKKQSLFLSADRPCSVTDSAYCFVFKTDAHDCRIKTLVITPYSYWTSVLESPVKYRSDSGTEELRYYGTGLSDQRCIMMDTSNFDWQWKSDNTTYSDIVGERTAQSAQVSALANTVGVGLTNPDNAVSISAVASRGAASYTGKSPLTIDLNNPEVVNFWPQCLEACTNAEVGVQFSTTMSNRNLPGSAVGGTVQLLKCLDENCTGTVPVLRTTDVYLDPATHFSVLKLANSQLTSGTLEPNTLYQVILSASSTSPLNVSNILWSSARFGNPLSYSKPYNKVFTWRFKTKNTACVLDHVTVDPSEYLANSITDRTTFTAASFSSPDTCSKEGQKLNPWLINWQWQSRDTKVAAVDTFTTKGSNQYCTNACIKKGSDIPAGGEVSAICGNGKIEAGEDCDGPDKNKGCSLDCRLMGSTAPTCGDGKVEPDLGEACDPKDPKTSQGCTVDCRHAGSNSEVNTQDVTASICGNGSIGAGEDCDKGISASTSDKNSSLNCSSTCVHTGTRISAQWCFANRLTQGGFSNEEYNRVCTTALSQCGNKVQEPDEDTGCDDPILGWNQAECNQFCLKKYPKQWSPHTEGLVYKMEEPW